MTLPEKIGQMVQIEATQVTDTSNSCTSTGGFNMPNPVCEQKIFVTNDVGSILAGGTDVPPDTTGNGGTGNTGLDWATEYNIMQSYAMQHSRLHIPVIFGVDAVHGFGHPWQAPLFPQSIGMGATWDPSAAKAGGEVTANALRATGWNWDFAPVQDLARDNRWGRTTRPGPRSLRSPPPWALRTWRAAERRRQALKVTATVKHFAGYSESINGHDRVQAELPIRYLQDTFLPSYAGGINAGAGTVMVDSGSVNGIPATASRFLLTTELRDRLGFKGVVISDYGDVPALATDLPHRRRPGRRSRDGDQRRRGRGHAALQRRAVADGCAAGRGQPQHLHGDDQSGGEADPHAEIRPRAVRPPDGRREQGRRRGPGRPRTSPCRPRASRSRYCATRRTSCRCPRRASSW